MKVPTTHAHMVRCRQDACVVFFWVRAPKKVPAILGHPNLHKPLYNLSFHVTFHFLSHFMILRYRGKRYSYLPNHPLSLNSFHPLSSFQKYLYFWETLNQYPHTTPIVPSEVPLVLGNLPIFTTASFQGKEHRPLGFRVQILGYSHPLPISLVRRQLGRGSLT